MSRAVVLDTLRGSAALAEYVTMPKNVLVNPNSDGRPDVFLGSFLVLRWEEMAPTSSFFDDGPRGPRNLTVWAHHPREDSTDYVRLENILDIVKDELTALEEVDGADGRTLTNVQFAASSGDSIDPGYNTICRTSTFKVLSRITAS